MSWTDQRSELSPDSVLDNIMLYWLPRAAASSARLYWESLHDVTRGSKDRSNPVTTSIRPPAAASFPTNYNVPRDAGPSSVSATSCTGMNPTGAAASPPGNSRRCSSTRSRGASRSSDRTRSALTVIAAGCLPRGCPRWLRFQAPRPERGAPTSTVDCSSHSGLSGRTRSSVTPTDGQGCRSSASTSDNRPALSAWWSSRHRPPRLAGAHLPAPSDRPLIRRCPVSTNRASRSARRGARGRQRCAHLRGSGR